MKVTIILLIYWSAVTALIAQDSTAAVCYTKKTFVIRKKNKDRPLIHSSKKEIVTTPIQKEITINSPLTVTTDNASLKDSTKVALLSSNDVPAKLPTLAGGEFGLMNIQIYKKEMDLKNWKFVVLEYSISPYGWATNAKILKTNDSRLEKLVLKKLRRSKWNPALNKMGQPIAYKMYQQVVIVKDRTYEEDYTNDY